MLFTAVDKSCTDFLTLSSTDAPVVPFEGILSQRASPECDCRCLTETDQFHQLICESLMAFFFKDTWLTF